MLAPCPRMSGGLWWLLMMPLRLSGKVFMFFGRAITALWGKIVSRCADELYLNVAMIYPLQGSIKSLEDIVGQGTAISEEKTWTGMACPLPLRS